MELADSAKRDPIVGVVTSVYVGKFDETASKRYTPRSIHASTESETSRVVFYLIKTRTF